MHVLWMSHRYLKQIIVICKEREHGLDDSQVTNDPNMVISNQDVGHRETTLLSGHAYPKHIC